MDNAVAKVLFTLPNRMSVSYFSFVFNHLLLRINQPHSDFKLDTNQKHAKTMRKMNNQKNRKSRFGILSYKMWPIHPHSISSFLSFHFFEHFFFLLLLFYFAYKMLMSMGNWRLYAKKEPSGCRLISACTRLFV